jgi:predicted nucleic acid-binding protein
MSPASAPPLVCLDANIFLAVLVPEATQAPKDEIAGAARVLRALEDGHLRAVSTAIVLGEIRYVYLREDKAGFEIARAAIESENNIRVLDITAPLAIHAAELRRRYYSKKKRIFLQRRPLLSHRVSRASRYADYYGSPSPFRH